MGTMTVYHGSYTAVPNPRIIRSTETKDFGPGFYCTRFRRQAQEWAMQHITPTVSVYTARIPSGLRILEFSEMTEKWLDFIIACRCGISHSYDIVSGPMANHQIAHFVDGYTSGNLTRDQFRDLAQLSYPTHQITFCTSRALRCLTFVSSEKVTPGQITLPTG